MLPADAEVHQGATVVVIDRQPGQSCRNRVGAVAGAEAERLDGRLADPRECARQRDPIVEISVEELDAVLVVVRAEESVVERRPFHVVRGV